MSGSTPEQLRDRFGDKNMNDNREKIMREICDDYAANGEYRVNRAEHKNIMLIGRTRTGKSTLKSLLVDPTRVAEEMTLKAGTRDAVFEAFHMQEKNIVLNIIDTPGLFEHGTSEIDIRDNETILRLISTCANREITKFHAICFCVAVTEGVNTEDIKSLKALADFLGPDVSGNSCLIVTRCEKKNDDQRRKIASELQSDSHFKELATFFKLGIFFSGALNGDDYIRGHEDLKGQFDTIMEYRKTLIELFTGDVPPFLVNELLISDVREQLKRGKEKEDELKELRHQVKMQKKLIEELQDARAEDEETAKLIDDLLDKVKIQPEPIPKPHKPICLIS